MPFTKIAPKAGLFTDGTRYSAQGTWYDSDKVVGLNMFWLPI